MSGPLSSRFSPRALDPDQRARLSVGREELVAALAAAVGDAALAGQARFDLVLGPWGAGKSHLLGLVEGRLRSSSELDARAQIVALPDEPRPTSLVQLFALILRELPDDPELGPAADALRSLERQRDVNQERRAVDLLRGRLGERPLIVLLEDLDALFDALGRAGQLRLRNVLQTERRWSMLATSRSLIPAFTKYEAPFHGTFNLHRLTPLSPAQCRDMLAKLAEVHARPGLARLLRSARGLRRVRAMHHLLGGNPRAMALAFRSLDERRLERFELALGELADELEPYARAQLARVSPAQRTIIELLAESWRPLTVTQLAERSFSSQASTSGALRHLRRDGVVADFQLGRERYYELGDPLVRLARANHRPGPTIAAFVRAVRAWYGDDVGDDPDARRYAALAGRAGEAWVARDASPRAAAAAQPAGLVELGQLLGPASASLSAVDRERALAAAVEAAWHRRELAGLHTSELERADLPALPRELLASAGVLARLEQAPASMSGEDLAALTRSFARLREQASDTELADARGLEVMLCMLLELGARLASEGHAELGPILAANRELFADALSLGLYPWIASRRDLQPLAGLAARLGEAPVLARAVIDAKHPREAVARLGEPERALVRAQLVRHGDHEGLAALGLAREQPRGRARQSAASG